MDVCICTWTDGWMGACVSRQMGGWVHVSVDRWVDGCMCQWTDGWMGACVSGQIGG